MTAAHTPTTAEIHDAWIEVHEQRHGDGLTDEQETELSAEFFRWLATVQR